MVFGFGGSSAAATGAAQSPASVAQKMQEIKTELKQQVNAHNIKELYQKMQRKCYAACVTKPGTTLSGTEETCLSRCSERYIEAFNIVFTTYVRAAQQQQQQLRQ